MSFWLWLKALHVALAILWVAGLMASALAVALFSSPSRPSPLVAASVLPALRRYDRWVSSPVMLAAWGLGILLASEGGWFSAPWLMAKLSVLIPLSALHGWQAGSLRKLATRPGFEPSPLLRLAPVAVFLAVIAVVVLVIVRPFG